MTENQKEFEALPAEPSPVPAIIVNDGAMSLFFDTARFELAQRVAKVFALSDMVPQQFQGNVGNCVIALNLADRMKCDPFMLMQNMYIVHGKPGIEAKLAIALVNNTGKFTALQYQYNEQKTSCYAYADRTSTGERCQGVLVTLEMAQAEGWMGKQGSKWKTMPELMLMYRSAMFFARAYCPEALLGMQTREELYDVGAVDLERDVSGSYAAPETTQDLQSRILNGKHGDQMSDADRDMGKTKDPDFDPLKEPVQVRYSEAKKAVIMKELESRGVEFNPAWSGGMLHQALLNDVPQQGAEAQDEKKSIEDINDEYDKLKGHRQVFETRKKQAPDAWGAACRQTGVNPNMGLQSMEEADNFNIVFEEIVESQTA